jgi:RimJ/RimL family protein N-acetyltransferase
LFGLKKKAPKNHTRASSLMLRPLEPCDNVNVCRWMSYPYIVQNSFVIKSPKIVPHDFGTYDYATRYFDMLITDRRRKTFAIMFSGIHIGNIGLKEINPEKLSAECFIEIGETQFRGHGLGTIAMGQLLDYAFINRGLLEVELEVLEFNAPAIKVYDSLGFRLKGHSGWHYDEYGQYWRVLKMAICSKSSHSF